MATKKKKNNNKKVILGTAALAAAAGAAALASNKKVRGKVVRSAKKIVNKAKTDPRVKQVGQEAGSFVTKLAEAIGNWFK